MYYLDRGKLLCLLILKSGNMVECLYKSNDILICKNVK